MEPSNLLKLENQLCHRFYTVSNAFTRAYRPLLESLDITYPQYLVLMALWETNNVLVSEVAAKTRIDSGALSLILKKLVVKDYITLTPEPHDKRSKRVSLSKKGIDARQDAQAVPEQMRCKIKGISVEEAKQLMTLIDKLYCDLAISETEMQA